jgi:hypothetical protein
VSAVTDVVLGLVRAASFYGAVIVLTAVCLVVFYTVAWCVGKFLRH